MDSLRAWVLQAHIRDLLLDGEPTCAAFNVAIAWVGSSSTGGDLRQLRGRLRFSVQAQAVEGGHRGTRQVVERKSVHSLLVPWRHRVAIRVVLDT